MAILILVFGLPTALLSAPSALKRCVTPAPSRPEQPLNRNGSAPPKRTFDPPTSSGCGGWKPDVRRPIDLSGIGAPTASPPRSQPLMALYISVMEPKTAVPCCSSFDGDAAYASCRRYLLHNHTERLKSCHPCAPRRSVLGNVGSIVPIRPSCHWLRVRPVDPVVPCASLQLPLLKAFGRTAITGFDQSSPSRCASTQLGRHCHDDEA